jgi:hypothetical protein
MAKRTTHRSSAGKKLYAVRDAEGQFVDIQTHENVSRADQRKTSKAEKSAKAKKAAKKKTTKKAAPRKTARKKAGRKKATK